MADGCQPTTHQAAACTVCCNSQRCAALVASKPFLLCRPKTSRSYRMDHRPCADRSTYTQHKHAHARARTHTDCSHSPAVPLEPSVLNSQCVKTEWYRHARTVLHAERAELTSAATVPVRSCLLCTGVFVFLHFGCILAFACVLPRWCFCSAVCASRHKRWATRSGLFRA